MAMFNGTKREEGSRTNTHLIKSGHASPAGQWLLDKTFQDSTMSSAFKDGSLFTYEQGGPGMESVVIPKGRVVGAAKPVLDAVTGVHKTVITLPGLALNANTVGVAPYNYTKDLLQDDAFGGNQVSIITQDYITVPYMPGTVASTEYTKTGVLDEESRISIQGKMPWGALIGKAESGDYVKGTPSGRFTKWAKGTDNPMDVVGQILELSLDQEQFGWAKWVLWDEASKGQDAEVINRAKEKATEQGFPFDPEYKEGLTAFQQYQTEMVSNPTGIPGLHDGSGNYLGYGINDTEYKDMDLGTLPTPLASEGIVVILNAKDYAGGNMKNLREGVTVSIDSVPVDASRVKINYESGQITLTTAVVDAGKKVTATYKAFHNGAMSYLDFKGVVGSASILLKR